MYLTGYDFSQKSQYNATTILWHFLHKLPNVKYDLQFGEICKISLTLSELFRIKTTSLTHQSGGYPAMAGTGTGICTYCLHRMRLRLVVTAN